MKMKLNKKQKWDILIYHYAKLLIFVSLFLLIFIIAGTLFFSLALRQDKFQQEKADYQMIKERLNSLEIKVQELLSKNAVDQNQPVIPINFKKIDGYSHWSILANDYVIGQIQSAIAITPKVIKVEGSSYYIGIYTEQNLNRSPVKIYELIRPVNILNEIFTVPEELYSAIVIYDLLPAKNWLLYSRGETLYIFDYQKNKLVYRFNLTYELNNQFSINNALLNSLGNKLAVNFLSQGDEPERLIQSRLFLIDLHDSQIYRVKNFPENQSCRLLAYGNEPLWQCTKN